MSGALSDLAFRADDVINVYRTAGVDLSLAEGDALPRDPSVYPGLSYAKVVAQYKQSDQACGHLILGSESQSLRQDVCGELLDVEARGVAVVYTASRYILRTRYTGLLQTCVHEIGHLLNLGHADISSDYSSAMNQADSRTDDIATAWKAAADEASVIRSRGLPPYISLNPQNPVSFPLAYSARLALNTMSPNRLLPWGSAFEHPNDGENDRCRLLGCVRI